MRLHLITQVRTKSLLSLPSPDVSREHLVRVTRSHAQIRSCSVVNKTPTHSVSDCDIGDDFRSPNRSLESAGSIEGRNTCLAAQRASSAETSGAGRASGSKGAGRHLGRSTQRQSTSRRDRHLRASRASGDQHNTRGSLQGWRRQPGRPRCTRPGAWLAVALLRSPRPVRRCRTGQHRAAGNCTWVCRKYGKCNRDASPPSLRRLPFPGRRAKPIPVAGCRSARFEGDEVDSKRCEEGGYQACTCEEIQVSCTAERGLVAYRVGYGLLSAFLLGFDGCKCSSRTNPGLLRSGFLIIVHRPCSSMTCKSVATFSPFLSTFIIRLSREFTE